MFRHDSRELFPQRLLTIHILRQQVDDRRQAHRSLKKNIGYSESWIGREVSVFRKLTNGNIRRSASPCLDIMQMLVAVKKL